MKLERVRRSKMKSVLFEGRVLSGPERRRGPADRFLRWTLVSGLLLLAGGPTMADEPSTRKEEEARLVRVARQLENAPLNDGAPELRTWALTWLIDHPDLEVKVCTAFLQPYLTSDRKYLAEINLQTAISSGAFVVENPDSREDRAAIYLAGLTGSLRVYEALAATDPGIKWRFMEGLVKKMYGGTLSTYIEKEMAKCE